MKKSTQLIAIIFCSLVLAYITSYSHAAEPLWPGEYTGVVHFNRWGECWIPNYFEIPPKLQPQMKRYSGKFIKGNFRNIRETIYGKHLYANEVKEIKVIDSPVEIEVQYFDPVSNKLNPEPFYQVQQGGEIQIEVNVKNISKKNIKIEAGRGTSSYCDLQLCLFRKRPTGPGKRDILGAGYLKGYGSLGFRGGEARRNLFERGDAQSEILVLKGFKHLPKKYKPSEFVRVIKKNDKAKWKVILKDLPANEYEFYVTYTVYSKKKDEYHYFRSNILRLDVLSKKGTPWQGLVAELKSVPSAKPNKSGAIPMRIHLRNTNKYPIEVSLTQQPSIPDRKKLSSYKEYYGMLTCYDREGFFIPWPKTPGYLVVNKTKLKAGEEYVIETKVPPQTATARVAYREILYIKSIKKCKAACPGYVLSKHVLFPQNKKKK